MLEVVPAGQRILPPEVADSATKLSPAPLQKHSLGGNTIDMPPSNCHLRGISLRRATPCLFFYRATLQRAECGPLSLLREERRRAEI